MKNIFFSLLLMSFNVFAQDDSIEIIKAPTLTEIGKPVGEKISQKITKDGGRIASADGRLELIIPEDALKSKINISIQPINNTLSPGKGNAYELEPSGITFQKPLQIIFHYTEKETIGVMPELKKIAWQDDKGQWYRLDNSAVDTTARTVTGNITHFSRWVFFDAFTLEPVAARVKVNKQLAMQIVNTGVPSPSGPAITGETLPSRIRLSTYVNGIRGGNAVVGTISPVNGQSLKFTAPANVPDRNPVAVSVESNSDFTFTDTTYHSLKLVSNITIIDKSYLITVLGYNKQNVVQCTIASVDSSTCVLQLNGSHSKIQEVQNMNYKIVVISCPCNVKELNPGGSIGPINIVGASRIDVVPANPPQKPYASVTIYFIRNIGVVAGMSVDPCLGHTGASSPPMPFPALPFVLQFDLKPEEQTIMKGGDDNNGFEVKVKPLVGDQQN